MIWSYSRFRRFAITPLFGVVTKGFNRGYLG